MPIKNLSATKTNMQVVAVVNDETYKAMMQVLLTVCFVMQEDQENWVVAPYLFSRIQNHKKKAIEFFSQFPVSKEVFTDLTTVIVKNGSLKDDETLMNALYKGIKGDWARIRLEKSLSDDELDLFRAALIFINKLGVSDPSFKKIVTKVSLLGDNSLSSLFEGEYAESDLNPINTIDPNEVKKELFGIVNRFSKVKSIFFPEGVGARAKAKDPKAYKQYLLLHRQLRESFSTRLRSYIRDEADGGLVDVNVIRKMAEAERVPHPIPKGFVGKIDDQGHFYTTEGLKLISNPSGDIRMNPEYDAKLDNAYVCIGKAPHAKGETRYYTEAYRQRQDKQKHGKTSIFVDVIAKMQIRWRKDLMSKDPNMYVKGAILEILYLTGARIGSKLTNSSGGKQSQGICTWHVNTIRKTGSSLKAHYMSKSEGLQTHYLRPDTKWGKRVIEVLTELKEGKAPGDLLFYIQPEGQRARHINSNEINAYIKALSGAQMTAKQFRTALGTQLFAKLMAESPIFTKKNKSALIEKAVKDEYNRILMAVGKALGHYRGDADGGQKLTGATAAKSYVDQSLLAAFWAKAGMRPPKAVGNIIRNGGVQ